MSSSKSRNRRRDKYRPAYEQPYMKHKGQKVPLGGVAEMLLCLSIGLLASAFAIAPMTLKAQEGSGEYQTRSPSDGAGLEPGPGTGVNNKPAPPDERLNEQK